MESANSGHAGVFSVVALLIILSAGAIAARIYYFQDFPVFTDEDQIDQAKSEQFGPFSPYL